jgi:hypothetical protein
LANFMLMMMLMTSLFGQVGLWASLSGVQDNVFTSTVKAFIFLRRNITVICQLLAGCAIPVPYSVQLPESLDANLSGLYTSKLWLEPATRYGTFMVICLQSIVVHFVARNMRTRLQPSVYIQ